MKMVKSLLLGSAAGLVAVAGAQAADLPVKAKPVQYVKICSLYGVGFYYIPGTDMCIKIGGWVRAEYAYGHNGNIDLGSVPTRNVNNRRPTTVIGARAATSRPMRVTRLNTARCVATSRLVCPRPSTADDVRHRTTFSANRAFIQWAGFTFGRRAVVLSTSTAIQRPLTGVRSRVLIPVTGLDRDRLYRAVRQRFLGDTRRGNAPARLSIASIASHWRRPLRRLPTVASRLPTSSPTCASTRHGVLPRSWAPASGQCRLYYAALAVRRQLVSGHPDDKLGLVVGAGIKLNAPMIGQGDYFQAQVNYTKARCEYHLPDRATSLGDQQ